LSSLGPPPAFPHAAAIDAVLTDPAVRESHLARGWDRYAETFTNAAIEQRFEALFDELVGSTPLPC
jgi:hypothetical protein